LGRITNHIENALESEVLSDNCLALAKSKVWVVDRQSVPGAFCFEKEELMSAMRTLRRAVAVAFAGAAFVLLAEPALAHHSFAMFDADKDQTIEGTVADFAWTNPHIWVDLLVTDADGKSQKWGLETQSIGILYRQGWTPDSLKRGDKVKAQLHPMKDGTPGGQLMKIVFPDGRELLTSMARRPAQAAPSP
jgi:hypothetical protein